MVEYQNSKTDDKPESNSQDDYARHIAERMRVLAEMRPISAGWSAHAEELARWAAGTVVVRTDAHGMYTATGSSLTAKTDLTADKLRDHFRGLRTLGVHSVRPGDSMGRVVVLDIDMHGKPRPRDEDDAAAQVEEEEYPPADPECNTRFAMSIFEEVQRRGLRPILVDSDGRGGFHLWVAFDRLVPAGQLRQLGQWLGRKHAHFGCRPPEVFPKQDQVLAGKFGSWTRLPGKHHKRDHWSRIWDGKQWLAGADAAKFLLGYEPSKVPMIPEEAGKYTPPEPVRPAKPAEWAGEYQGEKWWENYRGDLSTLDIVGLFAEHGMHVGGGGSWETVICPWHDRHTTGDTAGVMPAAGGKWPSFNCFHDHCKEKGLEEVLAFFGQAKVDEHCSRMMPEAQPAVDLNDIIKEAEPVRPEVKEPPPEPETNGKPEAGPAAPGAAEPKPEPKAAPGGTDYGAAYRFKPIDSATFDDRVYKIDWLVKGVLVDQAPAVMGGPKKALKTTLLVDLVLSLGSGEPFLGRFEVPRKRRAAIISGESGEHTLQETARRVALAKGIRLRDADVLWDFRLPQLSVEDELVALGQGLGAYEAEVVIIDPLYLCLLAGDASGKNAGNIFDMGPLLLQVARACLAAGATPILAAHARKGVKVPFDPLELEDLAWSGIQEFARQWLLVNRREGYTPGTGRHRLWLSAGGSVGHGDLWALDVREGVLADDFTGRVWDVAVMSPAEAVLQKNKEKEVKKGSADAQVEAAFLDRLDLCDSPPTKTALMTQLGWDKNKFARVFARLVEGRVIELVEADVTCGNGAKRGTSVIRRCAKTTHEG